MTIEYNADETGGGGGTLLGGTVMMISHENDIEIDNERYLRCGYVDTDTAGLDPSVVITGTYFEPQGGPTNFDRPLRVVVSDTGVMAVSHSDGGNTLAMSYDGGATWSNVVVAPSAYSEIYIDTDHAGNWVATSHDNNIGTTMFVSTDDGVTWVENDPTGSTTRELRTVVYSRETGTWMVLLFGSTSSSTDSGVYINDGTDITAPWTFRSIAGSGDTQYLIPPVDGNNTWVLFYGKSSNTETHLAKSTDNGVTWTLFAKDDVNWPSNGVCRGLYAFGNKVFFTTDSTSGGGDVLSIELDLLSNNPDTSTLATRVYPHSTTGGSTYSHLENAFLSTGGVGHVPPNRLNGIMYGKFGWATADGVNFYRLYPFPELVNEYSEFLYVTPTEVWKWHGIHSGAGLGNNNPLLRSIPVAGSGQPYIEGSAAQFMRIK
jgi:hypothetical protein